MNILITGTSRGIGRATAILFLERGYNVSGFDISPSTIENSAYTHYVVDITKPETFPEIDNVDILINAAGVQNSDDDILINLKGTINVTEKYGIREGIKAVLNFASASAHTGSEFPLYAASKGGVLSYTRNVALRISKYGATCNSISPGGVLTESNKPVMEDKTLWDEIMALTPLKKWATEEEIAEWIYFITVINKSMSGEDILIDNGETRLNSHFVWPDNK